MVADVNRNYFMVVFFSTLLTRKAQMESYGVLRCSSELLYGGICNSVLYLYEVFPMTYLVEQAGGQAFTG